MVMSDNLKKLSQKMGSVPLANFNEVISKIEAEENIVFPDGYKEFFSYCNGGEVQISEADWLHLWPLPEVQQDSNNYFPAIADDGYEEDYHYLFVFASDGLGNGYGVERGSDDNAIWKTELSNPNKAEMKYIADSLEGLIDFEKAHLDN